MTMPLSETKPNNSGPITTQEVYFGPAEKLSTSHCRPVMVGSADEFPLLSALGLYAADIRGDGNCLFNALSDQLYGHQNEHANIRSRVIEYMREHADYYKQFIDVHPGGGIRRNPKRKNAGAYSSPATFVPPSPAHIDRVFESHLQSMAKGGTYGDNMEITAFSSAFNYDVKIYQRDFAYMVTGADDTTVRPVAHIAYHVWEHYSSIRNLDGPHNGMPDVSPKVLSLEEEQKQKEKLAQTPHVMPWQIDVVAKSLPFLADKPTIKRALEAAKGDVNAAVSNLLDIEENGSTSSRQESSSVEREHDSDDDVFDAPNKKRDRRLSKVTRGQANGIRAPDSRNALSRLAVHDGSQESLNSWRSEASSVQESSQGSTHTLPTSVEASDPNANEDTIDVIHVSSGKSAPRLKILPPRPPEFAPKSASRITARDRKDIKKQAQKAARKERQQMAAKGTSNQATVQAGLTMRAKGLTQTPPIETLRTLYI